MKLTEDRKRGLVMLKLMVQGETDIQSGRHSDQREVYDRMKARIEARRRGKIGEAKGFGE